jgi:hypothetical protein
MKRTPAGYPLQPNTTSKASDVQKKVEHRCRRSRADPDIRHRVLDFGYLDSALAGHSRAHGGPD